MAEDLNDIYDGEIADDGGGGFKFTPQPGEPPATDGAATSDQFNFSPVERPEQLGGISKVSNVNVNKYDGYIPYGTYEHQDINALRGEHQSNLEKLGNAGVQTVGKFVTGVLEGFGYLPEIVTNPDGDYSNSWTRSMQGANSWMDENFPLYRSTSGGAGDGATYGDLSWWLQNAQGLVSSIGSFALIGGGVSRGLSAIGKLARVGKYAGKGVSALSRLSGASKMGALRTGVGVTQFGERMLTAGALAYTEGAMSGKRVFDEVYQYQLDKLRSEGMDNATADQEAKRIAASSAATTVQLNTTINTGMNMIGGVGMFFNHGRNNVLDVARKNLFAKSGEGSKAWLKRISASKGEDFARALGTRGTGLNRSAILETVRESTAEGIEEMTNQFAERTGIEEGKKGKTYGFLEQLAQVENYLDRTLDEEGALNFALGAIGGPGQAVVARNIPLHKIDQGVATNDKGEMIDASGQVVKTEKEAARKYLEGTNAIERALGRVSGRTRDKYRTEAEFNDIKGKIIEDAENIIKTEAKIEKAISSGNALEAQKLINEHFNVLNTNSVMLGFAENLAETYRSIAEADNTVTDSEEIQKKLEETKAKVAEAKKAGKDTTELETEATDLQNQLAVAKDQTTAQLLNFTASKEDNTYQDKAKQAVKTLEDLQKIYDDTHAEFNPDSVNINPNQKHVADIIFGRRAELKLLQEYKADLEKQRAESEVDKIENTSFDEEQRKAIEYDKDYHRVALRHNQTIEDVQILQKALENPTKATLTAAKQVAERYGVPYVLDGEAGIESFGHVIKRAKKILDQTSKTLKEGDEALFESEAFKTWQDKQGTGDKNKDFATYLDTLYQQHKKSESIDAAIDQAELDIANRKDYLAEVEDAKTMTRILKNTENFFQKIAEHDMHLKKVAADRRKLRILTDKAKQQAYATRLIEVLKSKTAELKLRQEELEGHLTTIDRLESQLAALQTAENMDLALIEATTNGIILTKDRLPALLERIESLENALEFTVNKLEQVAPEVVIEKELAEEESTEEEEETEEKTEIIGTTPSTEKEPEKEIEEVAVEQPPATKAYFDRLKGLNEATWQSIENARQAILQGAPFSYDALKDLVAFQELTQAEAAEIMQLMNEHLAELSAKDGAVEQAEEVAEELPAVIEAGTELASQRVVHVKEKVIHDGIPVRPRLIDTKEQNEENKFWSGNKQIAPSNSVSLNTVNYTVTEQADGEISRQSTFTLMPGVNLQMINPNESLVGKKIRLVVDSEYDKPIQVNTDATDTEKKQEEVFIEFDEFKQVSKDGVLMDQLKTDEESIDRIPIKIVDANDPKNILGYIHLTEWVNAKNGEQAESYRNTVDVIELPDGNVIRDNVASEVANLRALRKSVIEATNAGEEFLESEITEQGPGMLQFTKEWDKASTRLLGDIEVGAIVDGVIVGVNNPLQYTVDPDTSNTPVATIPMADGSRQYVYIKPTPLMGQDETSNATIKNITRALEVFMTADSEAKAEEVEAIKNITGIDISTYEGLRNYIIQYYTYLSQLKSYVNSKSAQPIMDILPKVGAKDPVILIATKEFGVVKEVAASLKDGKLTPEFKAALANLLKSRYKNIQIPNIKRNMTGVNQPGEFKEATYTDEGWVENKFDSYNQYVLKDMETNVTPVRNPDTEDGSVELVKKGRKRKSWVYAMNPVTKFKAAPIAENVPKVEPESVEIEEAEIVPEATETPSRKSRRKKRSEKTTPKRKTSVTVKQLEELQNALPLKERNKKSIFGVLQYYKKQGIDIPDGHNPFKKGC